MKAVNATAVGLQAKSIYGVRLAPGKGGSIVAASMADTEVTTQLARTDVSPFFIPTKDTPIVSASVTAPAGGTQLAAAAVYGNKGGRGGFEGWSCWSCQKGTGGFYVSAAIFNFGLGGGLGGTSGSDGYNFNMGDGTGIMGGQPGGTNGLRNGGYGGGPLGNFGSGPYGGGYGTGGWGGGYFGGFFSGSNIGGVNWGSACQIMCQRAWLGTGGVFGWGTGIAPGGWGPFGFFPFGGGNGGGLGGFGGGGGWGLGGLFGRRRMLQDGTADVQADFDATIDAASAAVDAASVSWARTAGLAVTVAQAETAKSMHPVCVASAPVCSAAAAASCPKGGEPSVTLSASVVQYGMLAPQSAGALSFAAPSIAVSKDGTMLLTATYSGAGKVKGSASPAYPGEWWFGQGE